MGKCRSEDSEMGEKEGGSVEGGVDGTDSLKELSRLGSRGLMK